MARKVAIVLFFFSLLFILLSSSIFAHEGINDDYPHAIELNYYWMSHDSDSLYLYWEKILDVDGSTLETISMWYLKDKSNVYFVSYNWEKRKNVEWADVETFDLLQNKEWYEIFDRNGYRFHYDKENYYIFWESVPSSEINRYYNEIENKNREDTKNMIIAFIGIFLLYFIPVGCYFATLKNKGTKGKWWRLIIFWILYAFLLAWIFQLLRLQLLAQFLVL